MRRILLMMAVSSELGQSGSNRFPDKAPEIKYIKDGIIETYYEEEEAGGDDEGLAIADDGIGENGQGVVGFIEIEHLPMGHGIDRFAMHQIGHPVRIPHLIRPGFRMESLPFITCGSNRVERYSCVNRAWMDVIAS